MLRRWVVNLVAFEALLCGVLVLLRALDSGEAGGGEPVSGAQLASDLAYGNLYILPTLVVYLIALRVVAERFGPRISAVALLPLGFPLAFVLAIRGWIDSNPYLLAWLLLPAVYSFCVRVTPLRERAR